MAAWHESPGQQQQYQHQQHDHYQQQQPYHPATSSPNLHQYSHQQQHQQPQPRFILYPSNEAASPNALEFDYASPLVVHEPLATPPHLRHQPQPPPVPVSHPHLLYNSPYAAQQHQPTYHDSNHEMHSTATAPGNLWHQPSWDSLQSQQLQQQHHHYPKSARSQAPTIGASEQAYQQHHQQQQPYCNQNDAFSLASSQTRYTDEDERDSVIMQQQQQQQQQYPRSMNHRATNRSTPHMSRRSSHANYTMPKQQHQHQLRLQFSESVSSLGSEALTQQQPQQYNARHRLHADPIYNQASASRPVSARQFNYQFTHDQHSIAPPQLQLNHRSSRPQTATQQRSRPQTATRSRPVSSAGMRPAAAASQASILLPKSNSRVNNAKMTLVRRSLTKLTPAIDTTSAAYRAALEMSVPFDKMLDMTESLVQQETMRAQQVQSHKRELEAEKQRKLTAIQEHESALAAAELSRQLREQQQREAWAKELQRQADKEATLASYQTQLQSQHHLNRLDLKSHSAALKEQQLTQLQEQQRASAAWQAALLQRLDENRSRYTAMDLAQNEALAKLYAQRQHLSLERRAEFDRLHEVKLKLQQRKEERQIQQQQQAQERSVLQRELDEEEAKWHRDQQAFDQQQQKEQQQQQQQQQREQQSRQQAPTSNRHRRRSSSRRTSLSELPPLQTEDEESQSDASAIEFKLKSAQMNARQAQSQHQPRSPQHQFQVQHATSVSSPRSLQPTQRSRRSSLAAHQHHVEELDDLDHIDSLKFED